MTEAAAFTLPDQTGTDRSLSDFSGQWLVLYFYPADDTPGCTLEACEFRDAKTVLDEAGIAIVGISPDPVAKHAKFAEKYHLNFPILADEDHAVMTAYKAWGKKKLFGKEYDGVTRKTYLIRPDGTVAKTYPKVTPLGHAQAILRDQKKLSQSER